MSGHSDENKPQEEEEEDNETAVVVTEPGPSTSGSQWSSLDSLEEKVNERYCLQREKVLT